MTQVHFTLNSEEVQSIIEHPVKEDASENIFDDSLQSVDRKSTSIIYSSG